MGEFLMFANILVFLKEMLNPTFSACFANSSIYVSIIVQLLCFIILYYFNIMFHVIHVYYIIIHV